MIKDLNARKKLDDNSYELDWDVPRVFEDLPENFERFRFSSIAHFKTVV